MNWGMFKTSYVYHIYAPVLSSRGGRWAMGTTYHEVDDVLLNMMLMLKMMLRLHKKMQCA